MAIYKGREVVIDQFVSSESPTVKVSYVGDLTNTEWVKLDQLALNKEEADMLWQQNVNYFHMIDENTHIASKPEVPQEDLEPHAPVPVDPTEAEAMEKGREEQLKQDQKERERLAKSQVDNSKKK